MRGRPTLDLMVLMLTATVCFAILATGATIAIIEIKDPSADTSNIVQSLLSIISGILGALLGLLAGKREQMLHPPEEERKEGPS